MVLLELEIMTSTCCRQTAGGRTDATQWVRDWYVPNLMMIFDDSVISVEMLNLDEKEHDDS